MCHSTTARPTHRVVVGRAVFVVWNPPTTTRSRTRTGFVFAASPTHRAALAQTDVAMLGEATRSQEHRPEPSSPASSFCECQSGLNSVVSRPCQGCSGSPPGSPPSSFCECHTEPSSVRHPLSPPKSPAIPACQALFASATESFGVHPPPSAVRQSRHGVYSVRHPPS